MFNDSVLTASDVKSNLETSRNETVSDDDVRLAINDFLSEIDIVRWENSGSSLRGRTSLTSVSTSGLDLTTITDLGDTEVGFYVYKDSVLQANQLPNTSMISGNEGYYIEGSTLFLSPVDKELDIIVVYAKKSPRIASTDILSSYTLPIPQRLEMSLGYYMRKVFYDGEFQFGLREDARKEFQASVVKFFTTKKRVTSV